MRLSFRQAWQLRGIEHSLRRSDPAIAEMLDNFDSLSLAGAASSPAEACSGAGWTWFAPAAVADALAAAAGRAGRLLSRAGRAWVETAPGAAGWFDSQRPADR